ncbi:MAG: ABC transporter ATP-binding protein [Alphaproteobacteria bacterium]|nr:ABC transporter ATP-binding protein [Alphaproteobacteria bacterium]MDE2337187.1 ABC transporter ATP-binding protein [Alphaproteobacteria bacterium]
MTGEQFAIDVTGLTKIYGGRAVVDGISLQVPRGRIYGFVGANGSGKTTTIRMLCGLLKPDRGGGSCLGHDLLSEADFIKRRVGYMTQKFSYWEDLSIRENLAFVADIFGLDRVRERVAAALERLGLAARAEQLVGTLSGGWKQRLALAAAILHEPDLLLLDEPTSGVDPKSRLEFWDEIHRLAAAGMTVLVSTHYMDETARCHDIIFMSEGKIITRGTAAEVVAQAGLTTWAVTGGDLVALMGKLKPLAGVDTVAPFGDNLHVSGTDKKALDTAIAPYKSDAAHRWHEAAPTMEDVFIHYMTAAKGGG